MAAEMFSVSLGHLIRRDTGTQTNSLPNPFCQNLSSPLTVSIRLMMLGYSHEADILHSSRQLGIIDWLRRPVIRH